MQKLEGTAYFFLRVVTGLMFFFHGVQKFFPSWFGMEPHQIPWERWAGGGIEFVGGLLIFFGLFTRPAAFLCCGMMAYAFWFMHFKEEAPLPIQNHGDSPVLYCFVFLLIFAKGGGPFSLDEPRKTKKLAGELGDV